MTKFNTSLIGPFSPPYNGDGIKNDYLKDGFNSMLSSSIECVDTIYRGQGRWNFFIRLISVLWNSEQIVLSLNKNGRIVIIPMFALFKLFSHKRGVLFVIGGSFDQQLMECNWVFRRLYIHSINCLEGVFVESNILRDGLLNAGVKNCSVVYNPRKDYGYRWHLNNSNRRQIIFVSRVTPSKGIFDLMDAVAQLVEKNRNTMKLHIYGHIDVECECEFRKRISEYPQVFKYGGVLQPDKVQQILSNYHLLALPTYHYGEGLPGILVEAGLCGIPIVITRFNSLGEYFKDDESAGFVNCRNVNELKNKIKQIIDDDELACRLSEGVQRVASPFLLEHVMHDVKEHLRDKGWRFDL